jgi:hypothetical protein
MTDGHALAGGFVIPDCRACARGGGQFFEHDGADVSRFRSMKRTIFVSVLWILVALFIIQEPIGVMIGLLGILILGALYGYWIGTVGKRRFWSGKRVKRVAGVPIMVVGLVLMIAAGLSRHGTAWANFPWVITVTAGVLAMLVAAKVSHPGVPLSELDRDDLPIR